MRSKNFPNKKAKEFYFTKTTNQFHTLFFWVNEPNKKVKSEDSQTKIQERQQEQDVTVLALLHSITFPQFR